MSPLPDYYQVLGCAASATPSEIKGAYRRAAMEAHPDRGGSHSRMVAVNEAWEILGDGKSRREYDRQRHGSTATPEMRETVKAARARASEYPSTWAEFEALLGRLTSDIRGTEYGSTKVGFWSVPTASGSVTGWLATGAGIVVGLIVAWSIPGYRQLVMREPTKPIVEQPPTVYNPYPRYPLSDPHGLNTNDRREPVKGPGHAALMLAPVVLGAGAGVMIHRAARFAVGSGGTPVEEANSTEGDAPTHVVERCPQCGQRLRVPSRDHLSITCPRCKLKFDGPTKL